jgi:hypothetical protein
MYGKFAQSAGHPRYGNPVYASLITAGCRTMILDAIATHPDGARAVLMVATDGVYFRSQHPSLPVSKVKLGLWDETERHNLTLFKPGVYWDDKTRQDIALGVEPRFKSRGVSAKALARKIDHIDKIFTGWKPDSTVFPVVTFTSGFSMITPLQALQGKNGRKWHEAGAVTSGKSLKQDSNPADKRFPILEFDEEYQIWRSIPHYQGDQLESTKYDKKFGFEDDEEKYGITDDGSVLDGWKRSLLGG